MRNFKWLRLLAGVVLSTGMLAGVTVAQEQEPGDELADVLQEAAEEVEVEAEVLQVLGDEDVVYVAKKRQAEPAFWLGLQTEAVSDPALRAQLGLGERGLVVVEVLAESPADKAGLKQYDVLIEAGGAPLRSVDDLLSTVGKHGGKPLTIVLLRGGKEISVQAQPGKRPASDMKAPPKELDVEVKAQHQTKQALDQLMGELHKHGGPGAMRLHFVGPGVVGGTAVAQTLELPKDVKVLISQEGKAPAEITVKRGEKSWTTTADKLDALPADVRPHVEQMLGRGGHWAYRVEQQLPADVRERFMKWTVPLPPGATPGVPVPPPGSKAVRVIGKVETAKPDVALADVQREVAKLRDELAALRKEISGRSAERELEKLLRQLLEQQKK